MSADSSVNTEESLALPDWLVAELPEHLPHSVISYRDDKFHISHDGSEFSTVVEAYDYLHSLRTSYQTVIDESVDGHGGKLLSGIFLCDKNEPEDKTSRGLLSFLTEQLTQDLADDYTIWLKETSAAYIEDPDNFLKAHAFLSHHPMFWHKGAEGKDHNWETSNGLVNMAVNVFPSDEGRPVIFLECGPHIPDTYMNFYYDPQIFVTEETFEVAIVRLAGKVYAHYNLDGTAHSETRAE